jgi:hypothetical protein
MNASLLRRILVIASIFYLTLPGDTVPGHEPNIEN